MLTLGMSIRTQASLKRALHEDVDGVRSWGDKVSWWWRMGRTVQLGLRNIGIWRSQVQK